jgi:pilus assembly protein CpaE
MVAKTIKVTLKVSNSKLLRKLQDILRSAEAYLFQAQQGPGSTDLMIYELGDDPDRDFQLIRSMLDQGSVDEIFLVSQNPDPSVLMQAMRMGVKECFSSPIDEGEVRQALERFVGRRERSAHDKPAKNGQIIDVVGSKGGVGTTTVAVNLAVNLSDMDDVGTVALVDMNMLFGEILLFLEIKPDKYHWGEIAKNTSRLDATFLMNALYKHSSGVYVLPSPAYLNGHHEATPENMKSLLNLMQTMFDFVVVDGGQSIDDTSLKILEISDLVLLISNLSLPCLSNTKKLLNSFYDLGYPSRARIRVVINRYLKNSEISLKDVESSIAQEVFWTIPNDYRTAVSAINQGKALGRVAARASITKNLWQLTDAVLNPDDNRGKRKKKSLKRT